jgi:hypothetical protein
MPYSTQEERDDLAAYINEVLPTFNRDVYSQYRRHRRRGIVSSEGVFVALTRFVLCEYYRGLILARYHNWETVLWKVWDAWTDIRREGDVDFLVTPGSRRQRSEQIKISMTTPGQEMIRVEVLRWHNGQKGAIYRVEGIVGTTSDSSGGTWRLVAPFA